MQSNLYKNNITDLKKELDDNLVKGIFPFISSVEALKNTNDGTRLNYAVRSPQKSYFLKIYGDNPKYISNLVRLNNVLRKKVNIPRVIAYKAYKSNSQTETYWLLYEYIEEDDQSAINYRLLIDELIKLHTFSYNDEYLKQVLKSDKLATAKKLLSANKNNLDLVDKAVSCLDKSSKTYGWCHFDLSLRHFLFSNEKYYILDLDNLKFDNILLDIASFVNNLLAESEANLIREIVKVYFQNNHKIFFDKKLFLDALVIMYYINNYSGDNAELNRYYMTINGLVAGLPDTIK